MTFETGSCFCEGLKSSRTGQEEQDTAGKEKEGVRASI